MITQTLRIMYGLFSTIAKKIIIIFVYQRRYYFIKLKYKILNNKINLAKNILFVQKTVISGKGVIAIGNNVKIGSRKGGYYHNGFFELQARFEDSCITIGKDTAFNNSCFIVSGNDINIGEDCMIGSNVTMMDFEAHGTQPENRHEIGRKGKIEIGNNVWIGNNVTILKDVKVGNGSIIAAGSVVLKGNYPSKSIIAGNPAKIVKNIE